jgi:microcystin-dependent protein
MSNYFTGEIQLFGFNFAPYQWSQCNGALLPIQQNTALFSLLGTYYGGDGRSSFGLPNLFDSAACNQGQGTGLSQRTIGETFGEPSVTLLSPQLPMHTHTFNLWNQSDTTKRSAKPTTNSALLVPLQTDPYPAAGTSSNTTFSPNMAAVAGPPGGAQPHENRQPALAINYCIALYGIFPSFS